MPMDMVQWYDASDSGNVTLSGSSVTAWNNKAGSGYGLAPLPRYGDTIG